MNEHIKYKDIAYKSKEISVIDYVKNLKNGIVKTLHKTKPVGFSVNTCKIEVFDGSGNLETESVSHNIVNEFQNKQAFWKFFYDDIRNGRNIQQCNPFSNILLTDYDGNENAIDLQYKGNVIGWANKYTAYVGSDILRGTINVVESDLEDYKKTGTVKAVFDFPTSAANGDIKSVWWLYGDKDSYKHLGDPYNAHNDKPSFGVDRCCDGEYLYVVNANSGIITRYNMNGSSGVSNIDFSSTSTNLRGIEFDGTYFWLYDATTKIVYKCNSSFVVISQFTANDVTGTVNGLTIFNNKVFIHTNANIYRYSNIGAFEAVKTSANYGFDATGISEVKANNAYFMICGKNGGSSFNGFLDGNGDLISKIDVTANGNYYDTNCFVRNAKYNNSRLYVRKLDVYGYLAHAMIGGIGAHTKLASTVQKTNANTMKITYTFDIDLATALTW